MSDLDLTQMTVPAKGEPVEIPIPTREEVSRGLASLVKPPIDADDARCFSTPRERAHLSPSTGLGCAGALPLGTSELHLTSR